jgi:hypothetical protein
MNCPGEGLDDDVSMSGAAMDVLNHTAVTEIPVVSGTVYGRIFTGLLPVGGETASGRPSR